MAALAGSLYLISTLAFGVLATVIGVRLLRLSRSTGQRQEGWLGLGLMLTAGLGYSVMMLAMVARPAAPEAMQGALIGLTAFGWICHNAGVGCMLHFTVRVFRPGKTWARRLALSMNGVLWVGWIGYVATGGLREMHSEGWYWVMISVIGTYPLWSGTESFRYHRLMRLREAHGLADPLIVNRFLLWSVASLLTAIAIWSINVPALSGEKPSPGEVSPLMSACMIFTAGIGIGTLAVYWLTFFPPRWYRRHLASGTAASTAPADTQRLQASP